MHDAGIYKTHWAIEKKLYYGREWGKKNIRRKKINALSPHPLVSEKLHRCGALTHVLPCFLLFFFSSSFPVSSGKAPPPPRTTRVTFAHQSQMALYMIKLCVVKFFFLSGRQGSLRPNPYPPPFLPAPKEVGAGHK